MPKTSTSLPSVEPVAASIAHAINAAQMLEPALSENLRVLLRLAASEAEKIALAAAKPVKKPKAASEPGKKAAKAQPVTKRASRKALANGATH